MAMVEEELYECEVLWPETRHGGGAPGNLMGSSAVAAPRVSRNHRRSSAPVDIPRGRCADLDDEDEDDGGAMVPPHLMVSRRWSEGKAAFSLRSGPGRAHRDLSHLRNSVLRMTGFIEG